jgi:hypothetical protein
MRKLALLLAASLFVSVPLISATSSISYAAAKKKAAAATPKPQANRGAGGREEVTDLNEVNTRFWRAINDLGYKLSQPPVWPNREGTTAGGRGGAGGAKGGRAAKGKRGRA